MSNPTDPIRKPLGPLSATSAPFVNNLCREINELNKIRYTKSEEIGVKEVNTHLTLIEECVQNLVTYIGRLEQGSQFEREQAEKDALLQKRIQMVDAHVTQLITLKLEVDKTVEDFKWSMQVLKSSISE
jgi:hypothetical protein